MPTANPTADEFINLLPSELGATVYIEIIVIDQASGVANVGVNTACGRSCDTFSGFTILRDLFDLHPEKTVREILNSKGRRVADYNAYFRDYNTNTLRTAGFNDVLGNRRSVIFANKVLSDAQVRFAMEHIGTHRETLPSRMSK